MFPGNKTEEIAKAYLAEDRNFRKAARGLTKEIIPNAVLATPEGYEVIGVHDVKEGNLEKFLIVQYQTMLAYQNIEGFRYKIDVRLKITEAMALLGLKAPEPLE
jgi:hypothetical protein